MVQSVGFINFLFCIISKNHRKANSQKYRIETVKSKIADNKAH
jgi:hypothetical protein